MFEKELEAFKKEQPAAKQNNTGGGFMVVYGDEILGVYNDRLDALKAGLEKYGNVAFLVKDINERLDDAINSISFTREIEVV